MFRASRQPVDIQNFTQYPYTGFILLGAAIAITVFSFYLLKPARGTGARSGSPV